MSGDGLGWYKRKPKLFLGGVRHLTDRQLAVYTIVLDLIYLDGGDTDNNPKFIAGHIRNLGTSATRTAINQLISLGKLKQNGTKLSNKRAENEIKTSRKRGKNESESSENTNEINDKNPRNARNKKQKQIESKEAAPFEDKGVEAAISVSVGKRCTDIMGVTNDPRWLSSWSLAGSWLNEGFDPELDIYPTVQEIMDRRKATGQGAPGALNYFTKAIRKNFEKRGGGKKSAVNIAVEVETVKQGTPEFTGWLNHIRGKGQKADFSARQPSLSVPMEWLNEFRNHGKVTVQ